MKTLKDHLAQRTAAAQRKNARSLKAVVLWKNKPSLLDAGTWQEGGKDAYGATQTTVKWPYGALERARKALAARKARRKKAVKLWGRPSLTALKKEVWTLLSLYVRLKNKKENGGVCVICRKNPATLGYHVVPKSNGAAAHWDLENVVAGCSPCNAKEFFARGFVFGRKAGSDGRQRHIEIFGEPKILELEARAAETVQYKADFFVDMRANLKKMIAEVA